MAKNRLHLDFTIYSAQERQDFISAYLDKKENSKIEDYIKKYNDDKAPFPFPYEPTSEELETMANYVLYGKTKATNRFNTRHKKTGKDGELSVVDAGYVEIPTRNSPWQRKEEESLDGLLDAAQETGNPIETQHGLTGSMSGQGQERVRYRVPKVVFSREKCRESLREQGQELLLSTFEHLWKRIDEIEFTIATYELRVGRRKLPIREELVGRLSDEQRESCEAHAARLNMFTWSKMRKLLVELRQEQYLLKDGYSNQLLVRAPMKYSGSSDGLLFKEVLPCGLKGGNGVFSDLLFTEEIEARHFSPSFQEQLLRFVMRQDVKIEEKGKGVLDFRNPEHVSLLIYARQDLAEHALAAPLEESEYVNQVIETLEYYVKRAKIEPLHRDIIRLKAEQRLNEDIASYVNGKYGKTYSTNYISTIYRAKCCGGVAKAAEEHWKVIDKLTIGQEAFKVCNACKRMLLRDADSFVRKAKASDGLAGRCKECDKAARKRR